MPNQKYARLSGDVVVETFTPPEDFAVADCFHPSIASQFVACPPEVEVHWTLAGKNWMQPIEPTTN